jgi:hypothetical protein
VIEDKVPVTVREQAGCPVDDFVFREADRYHYYQLKNDQRITWGESGHKLKREYIDQKSQCDARSEDHTLTVVVSHDHRRESLEGAVPAELDGSVRVLHFPEVRRPSELARHPDLDEPLSRLSASRSPGGELRRSIVEGFHLAWVECERAEDGSCALSEILAFLKERPAHRVRRALPAVIHDRWEEFQEILRGIPGLRFATDRGYLESSLPPRESGLIRTPCDDVGFLRFVDRVLVTRPATFDAFVESLP